METVIPFEVRRARVQAERSARKAEVDEALRSELRELRGYALNRYFQAIAAADPQVPLPEWLDRFERAWVDCIRRPSALSPQNCGDTLDD